jgi:hypothetical protein
MFSKILLCFMTSEIVMSIIVMSIIVNNDTMQKLSTQLSKKYQYLQEQRHYFNPIFESWLLLGNMKINDDIKCLLKQLTIYHKTNDDIGEALQRALDKCDSHTKPILKKYQIYNKHTLTDFAIIKFAADFYDKNIDELASDALDLFNSQSIQKIIFYLKNQIMHLIKCDILIVLGILFFHLKIAIITEDIYTSVHTELSSTIIKQILKNSSMEDILKKSMSERNSIVVKCINNLEKKYENSKAHHDNFALDRIKLIYDIYYQPFLHIESLDTVNYINQFPDSFVIIKDIDKINKKKIIDTYFYLIPIFYQCQKSMEMNAEPDKYFIKPKIFDISNNKLVIEI